MNKTLILYFFFLLLLITACTNQEAEQANQAPPETPGQATYITRAMDFNGPDTLYSGWNWITYQNSSSNTHFIMFEKYPEGKGIADAEKEVAGPFQQGMDYLNAGKMDSAIAALQRLPPWFGEVKFHGGSGLLSPGLSTRIAIELEPGTYMLECYVKDPNGKFHSAMGMVKEVHVKTERSHISPPPPTAQAFISAENGFSFNDNIYPGRHIIAVSFRNQKVYEHFLGHDFHLVQLEGDASTDTLQTWMNWMHKGGLVSPAPAGFRFVGGMQDLPAGKTGFFEIDLEAGRYALIAEVPAASEKKMLKVFEVGN